jgi:hypothetical protein
MKRKIMLNHLHIKKQSLRLVFFTPVADSLKYFRIAKNCNSEIYYSYLQPQLQY